jgi:hypothetical protein
MIIALRDGEGWLDIMLSDDDRVVDKKETDGG